MVKAIDIIRPACHHIGAIGGIEQPSADQISICLDTLNGILDMWSVLPQVAPKPIETVATLPASTPFLTIGPGQQINVARPSKIESAYARLQGQDNPIKVASKQKYDSIDQKSLGSTWPEVLWYDKGVPTGRVYFWPLSASGMEVHITTLSAIAAYADAEDSQDLPGGYLWCLQLTLAVTVAPIFELPVTPRLERNQMIAFDAIFPQNFEVPILELEGSPAIGTRLGQFISGGTC